MRLTAPLCAIALSLAFVACGGDDDDSAAGGATGGATGAAGTGEQLGDCELVTQEEASEALGRESGPGEESAGGCQYQAGNGDNFGVDARYGDGQFHFDTYLESTEQTGLADPKPVSGLGDEAVYDEADPTQIPGGATVTTGQLTVLSGEDYLSVTYSGEAEAAEVTREVAEIALGRL